MSSDRRPKYRRRLFVGNRVRVARTSISILAGCRCKVLAEASPDPKGWRTYKVSDGSETAWIDERLLYPERR